jgi:hypothetical protein
MKDTRKSLWPVVTGAMPSRTSATQPTTAYDRSVLSGGFGEPAVRAPHNTTPRKRVNTKGR